VVGAAYGRIECGLAESVPTEANVSQGTVSQSTAVTGTAEQRG
jgi:hypothetical protein